MRVRELASAVGITERAVAQILVDLEGSGYLIKERHGRRNAYVVNAEAHLRHPLESHRTIADILALAQEQPS